MINIWIIELFISFFAIFLCLCFSSSIDRSVFLIIVFKPEITWFVFVYSFSDFCLTLKKLLNGCIYLLINLSFKSIIEYNFEAKNKY